MIKELKQMPGLISRRFATFGCIAKENAPRRPVKEILDLLDKKAIHGDCVTYAYILRKCVSVNMFSEGKRIHAHIIKSGLEHDLFLRNLMVQMYLRCGCIEVALHLFEEIPNRGVILWTSIITAHVHAGECEAALKLFRQMQMDGVKPDKITFVTLLNACAQMEIIAVGKAIHELAVESGCTTDVTVGNCLVDMYGKCGSLGDASTYFEVMTNRDVVSWNAIIAANARAGCCSEVFHLFQRMQVEGMKTDRVTFISILNACAATENESKLVHDRIMESGFGFDLSMANALVNMYGKCGNLEGAMMMFYGMNERDVISWTGTIAVNAQHGCFETAFELYRKMIQEGWKPNKVTFASILNACVDVTEGRSVHSHVIQMCLDSDVTLGNALLNMYGKCQSLEDALIIFHGMEVKNTVSWNAMMATYNQHGYSKQSVRLFNAMLLEGFLPDKITFNSALDACADSEELTEGKNVHANIIACGLMRDTVLRTSVGNMYGRCGQLKEACQIFNELRQHDVVLWNMMISAYNYNGYFEEALEIFRNMQPEGLSPDKVTFITILNACGNMCEHQLDQAMAYSSSDVLEDGNEELVSEEWEMNAEVAVALNRGKLIHKQIKERGLESDMVVATAVMDMYGKCGSVEDARLIFDESQQHQHKWQHQQRHVPWNAMMAAYSRNRIYSESMNLFREMLHEGVTPDKISLVTALNSCGELVCGKMIHYSAVECGFGSDFVIGSAAVNMYSRCESPDDAREVFEKLPERNDVVSWNAMIGAYTQNDRRMEAVNLFRRMLCEGIVADYVTFIVVMNACADVAVRKEEGKWVLDLLVKESGIEVDGALGNVVLNFFASYGDIAEASDLHEKGVKMRESVVCWNVMMGAYIRKGMWKESMMIWKGMHLEGVMPNRMTFFSVLTACGNLTAMGYGRSVHLCVMEKGMESEMVVGTGLVIMYSKCGSLEEACSVFKKMIKPNYYAWNALVAAYGHYGNVEEGVKTYRRMQQDGGKADESTFANILSACSHGGMVEDGREWFLCMTQEHEIVPSLAHYGCMVDLLGRAGRLDEAELVMKKMKTAAATTVATSATATATATTAAAVLWMTVAGACRVHGDLNRGRNAAERILELDPGCCAAHIVLSNFDATAAASAAAAAAAAAHAT